MAADTKRGAPEYVTVEWDRGREGVAISVVRLREQLAAQGLHVVTAADKAVLKELDSIPTAVIEWWREHGTVQQSNLAVVELARREAAK